ncbi:uncharacterized protein A1O9_09848 [Exophiala aquamarina CBS 119918]|uniref:Glycolipid transfer protein domain-containing protein n=1 Tax=Exophiala aquamarina CBS 119918 TaxID=1182545 RepID=A0A072P454_9EURO|nr:uncharacterized protein A1O9_09848 [Exophiala aquamarina CBS 119918]KEF54053.1 hypothetical protein A1O9_09848 [Exophiala aquamarina CBS 119918]
MAYDNTSGRTWFDTPNVQFSDVTISIDQEVSTTEFLEATESMTTIFDLLGSAMFTPIKQDLLFNVRRVRTRQQQAPEASGTLQSLVRAELSLKAQPATEGIIWIVRALDFMTEVFMIEMQVAASEASAKCNNKELANSFKESYETTLQPYHNAFIRLIFKAALNAAPKRRNFYQALIGEHGDPETGDTKMKQWATSLKRIVTILKQFLASDEALNKWAKTKV